jgi:hypothetical protein
VLTFHIFAFPLNICLLWVPGNVGGQEHEAVYVDPSSSSSYPASDDCFEMEEEVGKRFYPMVPVAVSLLIL